MSTTPSPKKKSEYLGDLTASEIKLILANDDHDGSNAKGKSPAKTRAKKRGGKVLDSQLEPEPEIKTEAKPGESAKNAVKIEVESGESSDSPVKVEADTDTKIKLQPTD
ncbi:hypothetical protein PDIG_16590 [Penicillium digitatum PHI26]|uniref:Uncharacterized protein n=2 Tax=Penicillium digitatum TaxID=36651 RepID=K9G849_PEND2|nr:hypothetical protein PDIP_88100 [Penicillium digitatum Pd1]EKV04302.1 hypothetical protein PDIP_88100 [Penicillium digitatum Pd1]EKV17172.1 hypothetical protein PDIG_16590 [Penicillium digitatum PHI26]